MNPVVVGKNHPKEPLKLLVLNGPNLNLLGLREPEIYGKQTYADLVSAVRAECKKRGIRARFLQTNSEGVLVTAIQNAYRKFDGIIINPAAYTHTSVALLDAVKAVGVPTVEVHLSDVNEREEFRKISYAGQACRKTFAGYGFEGYKMAILFLKELLETQ